MARGKLYGFDEQSVRRIIAELFRNEALSRGRGSISLVVEPSSSVPMRWALFELTTDLDPGTSASATRQAFDLGTNDWVTAGLPTDTVWDSIGDKTGQPGDRCWCYFSDESRRWEVIQLRC